MLGKLIQALSIICIIVITSCAGTQQKNRAAMAGPAIPLIRNQSFDRETYVKDPTSAAGLWNEATSGDIFQDLRAHKVGDLVTVNIVETSQASKSASTQTSRKSSIDAGIGNLLGWEGKLKNLTSFGNSGVRKAFDNTSMLNGSLTSSFNGTGSTSRDDSMTASITARVIEVEPNGNLLIRGTRQVTVNHETQVIILSGLIRPTDIAPDNTILSSYIGDARIEYVGRGPVSDKQRPGWLARAVDFIWPF